MTLRRFLWPALALAAAAIVPPAFPSPAAAPTRPGLPARSVAAQLPTVATGAPPRYSVRALDAFGPEENAGGLRINGRGEVAGAVDTGKTEKGGGEDADSLSRPATWTAGRLRPIRTRLLAPDVHINDFAADGSIAASAGDTDSGAITISDSHAVVWNARTGRTRVLGLVRTGEGARYTCATAEGINRHGDVCGTISACAPFEIPESVHERERNANPAIASRAVVWPAGSTVPIDLGAGEANAINDRGEVVGKDEEGAALWRGADRISLGGWMLQPRAINNRGQVVGERSQPRGGDEAFLWESGELKTLPLPGGNGCREVCAVNDRGQVVGSVWKGKGETAAVLWHGGKVYELSALLPPGSGWVLLRATDINNSGQIVGFGTWKGKTRAFLLTPSIGSRPAQSK